MECRTRHVNAYTGHDLTRALFPLLRHCCAIGKSDPCQHPSTLIAPILMSSIATPFQSILDAALDSYSKQTGIDLTKHPSADQFKNCRSSDDVVLILLERESAFSDYREKYCSLINCLRPIIPVVRAFSSVLGEVNDIRCSVLLYAPHLIIHFASLQVPYGPFQPAKAIFIGIDVLLSVRMQCNTGTSSISPLRYLSASGSYWRQ